MIEHAFIPLHKTLTRANFQISQAFRGKKRDWLLAHRGVNIKSNSCCAEIVKIMWNENQLSDLDVWNDESDV